MGSKLKKSEHFINSFHWIYIIIERYIAILIIACAVFFSHSRFVSYINSLFSPIFLYVRVTVVVALLPVSFEFDFMKQFCGEESSYYFRGMCNVDWALYVVMVVTVCASLSAFSGHICHEYLRWTPNSCC